MGGRREESWGGIWGEYEGVILGGCQVFSGTIFGGCWKLLWEMEILVKKNLDFGPS